MQCPENYQGCKSYRPKNESESRCVSDSTVGACVKERKTWGKEIDNYFQEYDKSKIIR